MTYISQSSDFTSYFKDYLLNVIPSDNESV